MSQSPEPRIMGWIGRFWRAVAVALLAAAALAPLAHARGRVVTVSPNADGVNDVVRFKVRLDSPGPVTLVVARLQPPRTVATRRFDGHSGVNTLAWSPRKDLPARTYATRIRFRRDGSPVAVDGPLVRVQMIDAAFTRTRYRPGATAHLVVRTDAARLTLEVFRAGARGLRTDRDAAAIGLRVAPPRAVRPGTIALRVGAWPSGLYLARLTADDGRACFAPLVVGASWARNARNRVAVVLPTNTWQAYNFYDADADGLGDTWYSRWSQPARLGRPYGGVGLPPHFHEYDLPFLRWFADRGFHADFLTDDDLDGSTGVALARSYDLLVFPGHHEYVTRRAYDAVEGFRDRGGNLAFLSADNFGWQVRKVGPTMRRIAQWRRLRRPEAALIGVQYRGSDRGQHRGSFVVRDVAGAPWLFADTRLKRGMHFGGGFGIEVDSTTAASPPTTRVIAEIPNLIGPGISAQMTYYETPRGAKVFAAGAFTLGGSRDGVVLRLLDNLWKHLSQP